MFVDDEPDVLASLVLAFEARDHQTEAYSDARRALRRLRESDFDVLVADVRMPEMDGLELLARVKQAAPKTEVVLMSGYATLEIARTGFLRGAADFVTKPFSTRDELVPIIDRLLQTAPAAEENAAGPSEADLENLAPTQSAAMRQAMTRVAKVADSPFAVLLTGQSGTGKSVIARRIHSLSSRSRGPFVSLNCATLPETLVESELFGASKGAFTGAACRRSGYFEAASGGTLLLDEIGELPLPAQPKLLRVLQDQKFHLVGDPRHEVAVNTRIIAATNQDLEKAVAEGTFRADLYYRLSVVPIRLPSIGERPEDLPGLIDYFRKRAAPDASLSPEAERALLAYEWPGNLRELEHALEHAGLMSTGGEIQLHDLPVAVIRSRAGSSRPAATDDSGETLGGTEMRMIARAVVATHGNRTQAARLLGISRRTLGYRISKYELDPEIERALARLPTKVRQPCHRHREEKRRG